MWGIRGWVPSPWAPEPSSSGGWKWRFSLKSRYSQNGFYVPKGTFDKISNSRSNKTNVFFSAAGKSKCCLHPPPFCVRSSEFSISCHKKEINAEKWNDMFRSSVDNTDKRINTLREEKHAERTSPLTMLRSGLNAGPSRLIRKSKSKIRINQILNWGMLISIAETGVQGVQIIQEFGLSMFGLTGTHLYAQTRVIRTGLLWTFTQFEQNSFSVSTRCRMTCTVSSSA